MRACAHYVTERQCGHSQRRAYAVSQEEDDHEAAQCA